jgi:hypothetical protein
VRALIASIEGEWRRYKVLGDRAIQQVGDDELGKEGPGGGNSIAVIAVHIAGNLKSRFSDFLNSDGEKPWRDRDSEFQPRPNISRSELLETWNAGWKTLFDAVAPLTDADLVRTVTIRGETFFVHETLQRLLAHTSYHVGQIVYLAKAYRGNEWDCLSIPLGKSAEFNRKTGHQRPPDKI